MAIIKAINSKSSIRNIVNYIADRNKTNDELITGLNCSNNPENAIDDMETTKEFYKKTTGRQYKHFVQSFSPEDKITSEKANKIGKEWAEKCFRNYEVLIATHTDKDHIHNHFIVNSVSFENGEKLRYSSRELGKFKEINNEICEREHLKKIDLDKKNSILKTDGEYRIEKRGQETWKGELREVIELELKKSKNLEEFRENLKEKYDVETRVTKNTITYKHPTQNKAIRGKRLGGNYTKESVLNEFNKQADRTISERNNRGREENISKRTIERVEQNKQTGVRKQSFEGNFNRVYGSIGEIERGAKQFSIKAREEEQRAREESERIRREQQNSRKEFEQRVREDRGNYKTRGFDIER